MIRGHLDALTSSGFVEGWAFDDAALLTPLAVAVFAGDEEVGAGLANVYRRDLIDAACGIGWNAFRLRVSRPVSEVAEAALRLCVMPEANEIVRVAGLRLAEESEAPIVSFDELARADPTLLQDVTQLAGCEGVFAAFIDAVGIEAFLATAYIYVLGRPVDAGALAAHAAYLREESMTPYEVVASLYASDEFRAAPRHLAAPTEPGFPFQLA